VTLTTPEGLQMRIGTDPVDEKIAHQLLGPRRADYFPEQLIALPANPCILDVGAHHGLYAVAALHEYPGSRIICVEPSADALHALRANVALNRCGDRVRIVHAALASDRGVGELRHTTDGTWGFSLYEDEELAVDSEVVPLMTLADILDDDRPDIVKSNAEGAEFTFIGQLLDTDLRPLLMIVMVHPQFGDMERLLGLAASMGYRVEHTGLGHRPVLHMWFRGE
jgi:FkbM family methyltransferase